MSPRPAGRPASATPAVASPGARRSLSAPARCDWLGRAENGVLPTTSPTSTSCVPSIASPTARRSRMDTQAGDVERDAEVRSSSRRSNDEAVVVGTDPNGADAVLVVALPTPAIRRPKPPSARRGAEVAVDPTPPASAERRTGRSASSDRPSRRPSASRRPAPTLDRADRAGDLRRTDRGVEPTATCEPTETEDPPRPGRRAPGRQSSPQRNGRGHASPTSRSWVVAAAYSPDGAWFAFSARPADGSARPRHLRLARRRRAGTAAHDRPRQRLRIMGRGPDPGQPRRRGRPVDGSRRR